MSEEVKAVLDKLQDANKLMEQLIETGLEDGKLSEDEQQILLSINSNLEIYARKIIASVSDGTVDDEEEKEIERLEQKIIKDAEFIAARDDKMTDEELKLVKELIQTIDKLV